MLQWDRVIQNFKVKNFQKFRTSEIFRIYGMTNELYFCLETLGVFVHYNAFLMTLNDFEHASNPL